ncbi:MAG: hypothetical protein ABH842_02835 [Candidatus Micrarchaeota archaeon]
MNYKYIPLILLLLYTGMVYADCSGYQETFDVRVLDAKNRTVEGALIQVKFDRGTSFGDQYFVTEPQPTNSGGIVTYKILNQGTNTREIDCNIYINATIGGTSATKTIVVSEHGSIVDLRIEDLYPARFYIKDQYKIGIPNSTVTVDVWGPGTTDSTGVVKGYLKAGSHQYFASHKDASEGGVVDVVDDVYFEIIFPHYPITIEVTDDYGVPLNATITIFNETFELENGEFQHPEVFGQQVPYEIVYLGEVVEGTMDPATDPDLEIRFDVHAPTISEVKQETTNNRPKLSITVTDTGVYPSGLDVSSMKVWYKQEPSGPNDLWHPAVVFTTAKGQFTAEFPEMEPNTIISFKIEIKDQATNKAELEGKFTTLVVENPQNTTGNNSNPQPDPPKEQEIPLLYIIGGVFVLVLAVYLVIRIKSKATDGDS